LVGWDRGGTGKAIDHRAAQMWNGGYTFPGHFGKDTKRDFPRRVAVPKAGAVVVPRTSRAAVVYVSNVIYQNGYLIRLINVSAFLSN